VLDGQGYAGVFANSFGFAYLKVLIGSE